MASTAITPSFGTIASDTATPEQIDHAVLEYGNAIRELASANIFPEEFSSLRRGSPKVRAAFFNYHRHLLSIDFWKTTQQKILAGYVEDFIHYPEELRFRDAFKNT